MKIIVYFLAVICYAVALPAGTNFKEVEHEVLVPNNIFLEPINPVVPQSVDLPGGRIIGGTEVAPNSVPYQVAVIINGVSLCGGSLISATRVLTAAHCTISASFVNVRLGAHAFNELESTQVRITSTSIINHANYNVGSFAANDISIVTLPSPTPLNDYIGVIALAPANAGTYEGSTAFLSGWGQTSDSSSALSPVLRGVNLSVLGNARCGGYYGGSIVDSTICTSGEGVVGACSSDSGGPLVVDGVQIGIVSFGSSICEFEYPTAFARISYFRTWIQENAGV